MHANINKSSHNVKNRRLNNLTNSHTTSNCSSKSCRKAALDTNTQSVEQINPIIAKHLVKQANRIDFLKDKNTGKKLKTLQEMASNKNTRHTFCGYCSKHEPVDIGSNSNSIAFHC